MAELTFGAFDFVPPARYKSEVSVRYAPFVALIALLAMALSACDSDVVRFGPALGLRIRGGDGEFSECPLPQGSTGDTCPDWATEIFPLFDGPTYGCTLTTCHGGATEPIMPAGDADQSYDALANYVNPQLPSVDGEPRPYIEAGPYPNDVNPSYLLCNINFADDVSLGSPMPKGFGALAGADLIAVGNWVACGMQKSTSLGAGGGGVGGAAPAGGAGGV